MVLICPIDHSTTCDSRIHMNCMTINIYIYIFFTFVFVYSNKMSNMLGHQKLGANIKEVMGY